MTKHPTVFLQPYVADFLQQYTGVGHYSITVDFLNQLIAVMSLKLLLKGDPEVIKATENSFIYGGIVDFINSHKNAGWLKTFLDCDEELRDYLERVEVLRSQRL